MPLRSLEATLAHNGHGHLAFALPHRHFPFAFLLRLSIGRKVFADSPGLLDEVANAKSKGVIIVTRFHTL
jgi:hypothetical protein